MIMRSPEPHPSEYADAPLYIDAAIRLIGQAIAMTRDAGLSPRIGDALMDVVRDIADERPDLFGTAANEDDD
jgi:hypothetical protein